MSSVYARMASRRDANVAAVAVARTILEIYYHIIAEVSNYNDLGVCYYDTRNLEHICNWSVKRLEGLGYKVKFIWHIMGCDSVSAIYITYFCLFVRTNFRDYYNRLYILH